MIEKNYRFNDVIATTIINRFTLIYQLTKDIITEPKSQKKNPSTTKSNKHPSIGSGNVTNLYNALFKA